MPNYVLTVVTARNDFLHSMHDTEDAARAEQRELLEKLNNRPQAIQQPFVQVGDHTIRLNDVERTMVTTEDEAPGLASFGIA